MKASDKRWALAPEDTGVVFALVYNTAGAKTA
jgi:hypothetical protein